MGHDKIDSIIKKKLETRSVMPKENTWNRLETLLEAEQEQKTSIAFYKYGIAASILLLLGIFLFTFNKNQTEAPSTTIVNTNTQPNTNNLQNKPVNNSIETTIEVAKENTQKQLLITNKKEVKQQPQQIIAQHVIKKNITPKKEIIATLQNKENNTTVASLNNSKNNSASIKINNEVDSLLAAALAQTTKHKVNTKPNKNLEANAKALLANVEQELDLSFKDKVFKKFKNGFQKTRTAEVIINK